MIIITVVCLLFLLRVFNSLDQPHPTRFNTEYLLLEIFYLPSLVFLFSLTNFQFNNPQTIKWEEPSIVQLVKQYQNTYHPLHSNYQVSVSWINKCSINVRSFGILELWIQRDWGHPFLFQKGTWEDARYRLRILNLTILCIIYLLLFSV